MLNKEDILRMAREAGWAVHAYNSEIVERFAALVAAAERTRACRIVTGLCISDNNAREICEAVRSEE
jgi:fructose/tagatose bisphosphate aldolase